MQHYNRMQHIALKTSCHDYIPCHSAFKKYRYVIVSNVRSTCRVYYIVQRSQKANRSSAFPQPLLHLGIRSTFTFSRWVCHPMQVILHPPPPPPPSISVKRVFPRAQRKCNDPDQDWRFGFQKTVCHRKHLNRIH